MLECRCKGEAAPDGDIGLHVLAQHHHRTQVPQVEGHIARLPSLVRVVAEHRMSIHSHGCLQGAATASCARSTQGTHNEHPQSWNTEGEYRMEHRMSIHSHGTQKGNAEWNTA
eukprot:1160491-Pelagomonas_calceolata.AAC.2